MSDSSADNAPGWQAIDRALEPLYHGLEPAHYGNVLPFRLGGAEPLHGISIYRREEPRPHFHYITYGFSDLWGEGDVGGDFSKFGFELTFCLACKADEIDPPKWPLSFLQNIAKYVFKTGNHFEAGHHVNCNGPIALEHDTEIAFIAFAHDPELPPIATPYGRVEFLQIVGLVADEYETIKAWSTEKFLAILARQYPLLITDLDRHSILRDTTIAQEVEQAASKEGSLQSAVYAMVVTFAADERAARVTISANCIGDMLLMFDHQLAKGGPCAVIGPEQAVRLIAAEACGWRVVESVLEVSLSPDLRAAMRSTLRIERGEYRWDALPAFVLVVKATEIKDAEGNIVCVIG
jgi:hypothetical protein